MNFVHFRLTTILHQVLNFVRNRQFFVLLFVFLVVSNCRQQNGINNNGFFFFVVVAQQQQDPMTLNGGSVLAMAGKDCVALAIDKRFGFGNKLIHVGPRPVLIIPQPKPTSSASLVDVISSYETEKNDDGEDYQRINNFGGSGSAVMVAFTGLQGDIHSIMVELSAQVNRKLSRGLGFQSSGEPCFVSPTAMASLTSHMLYNRKGSPYYVEPIIIGIEKCFHHTDTTNNKISKSQGSDRIHSPRDPTTLIGTKQTGSSYYYRPYLCSMDIIGAMSKSNAFVCAGAASKSLFGTAEAYWKPNLSEEELIETCSKAFFSALERDCLSGYGALIYLLTKDGRIIEYDIESRSD